MKKFYLLLTCVTMIFFTSVFAKEDTKKIMNEIDFKKYKDFDKKWKLVTVRFRKDTEEMRYTYANPIAYKTLLAGKTNYPSGAVFGKVGVRTGSDPLFESSLVPLGARRYQLMVRNNEKYKEQNGWGYALFDERGYPFPEDHKTQVVACASCHNIAEERGYVFSQIGHTAPRAEQRPWAMKSAKAIIEFKMIPRKELSPNILKHIPEEFNFVRILVGDIAQNIFQGTLEEIRPVLSKESFESRQPAILKNTDNTRFSIVFPEQLGALCSDHGKSGIYMKSFFTNLNKDEGLSSLSFCLTKD